MRQSEKENEERSDKREDERIGDEDSKQGEKTRR